MEIEVIKYYRKLFRLPSIRLIMIIHILLGLVWGFHIDGLNLNSVFKGILVLTLIPLLSDLAVYLTCRREPLLRFRRISALTLTSNIMLFLTSLISKPLVALGFPPERTLTIGLPISSALRFMVFRSLVFHTTAQALFIVQPFTFLVSIIYFHAVSPSLSLLASIGLALLATHIYLKLVGLDAERLLGFDGLSLFRAFLASWMEDLSEPIEAFLEELSVKSKRHIDLLTFEASEGKTAVIVPYIHPGPFRSVGGSLLPYRVQSLMEKLGFKAVAVPHGPSTHRYNPVSRREVSKVLNALAQLSFEYRLKRASRMVREFSRNRHASASCQVFEEIALVTLTLAPEPMEDLPPKIRDMLEDYGRRLGFKSVIVVDAHNSMSWDLRPVNQRGFSALLEAGRKALKTCSKAGVYGFKLGFSSRRLKGYDVEDGLGPGGLTVHLFMVEDELYAYVTIDGNNMVTGLRGRIIEALRREGVSEAEVLTTDTHVVNATVSGRGYHPVGEKVDEERLIESICDAFREAYRGLKPASACYRRVEVGDLKLLGDGLSKLISSLDFSVQNAKELAVKLLAPALVVCSLIALV